MSFQARRASKRSACGPGATRLVAAAPKKSWVAAYTTAPPSTSWTARMMTRARIAVGRGLIVGGDRFEQVGEALARRLPPSRHVLARDAVGRRLVPTQDHLGHALAVHLVRPVVEAGGARVAVHGLERHVG